MRSQSFSSFTKFLLGICTLCFFLWARPAAATPTLIPVVITGEAEACIFNSPGQYFCQGGALLGHFTFDSLTNSVVGSWSIDWVDQETFSGSGNAVVSGSSLATDEFNFDAFVFNDLQLTDFPCPVGNGGDFCNFQGALQPLTTPEPASLPLLFTGLVGLFATARISPSIRRSLAKP